MAEPRTPATRPRLNRVEAQKKILDGIQKGKSVAEACRLAGKSEKTYEWYRKQFPDFRAQVDLIRAVRRGAISEHRAGQAKDFPDFCEKYLNHKVFWHQMQWVDLLEGREPRDLHPSELYEPGQPNYVLVNTPPEHSKSTTLTIDYCTYRICQDPNVRIMIVSKTQVRAKEFVYAIKYRLTNPLYKDLQIAYAPADGFNSDDAVWQADRIYIGNRESSEKDPTLQAVGIGGQVYGSRCSLIIVDDAVVGSNAHQYETQIRWLQQEVLTRLGPTGKLVVVGTRIDAIDLYRELREPGRYPTGVSPWTYLAQPAVLEFSDDPDEWVTLWPRTDQPWAGSGDPPDADGLYPRWNGHYLSRRRGVLDTKTWSLTYQQADVTEDSVFDPLKVRGAVEGRRQAGPMYPGAWGHRERGMDGLYVIGGCDPAMVGDTGVVILGADRASRRRYVLDVRVCTRPSPTWIRETIKECTERYNIAEWRIEKNAFQIFLTQDPEIQQFCSSRGVRIGEHFTGRNKWDSAFGVASMSGLFEPEAASGKPLIELPSPKKHPTVQLLMEQLITWAPDTKNKQDLVMALWFAELAARDHVNVLGRGGQAHLNNPHLTRRARMDRQVINLAEVRAELERDSGLPIYAG